MSADYATLPAMLKPLCTRRKPPNPPSHYPENNSCDRNYKLDFAGHVTIEQQISPSALAPVRAL